LADIADARLELEDAASGEPVHESPAVSHHAPPLWRRLLVPAAIAIAAATVAAALTWMSRPTVALPIVRYAIPLAVGDEFTAAQATRQVVAISPDGALIAYMANGRLYLRARDRLTSTPVTTGGSPFFAPDGQSLAFWEAGQLKRVSASGGAPVVLCETPVLWGATWTAENTILYGQGPAGIWRVSAGGGKPEQLIKLDAGQRAHGPQLLPAGRAVPPRDTGRTSVTRVAFAPPVL